jgi:hypothetical protein
MDKVKFYDVKARKSVLVDESKTKKEVRKGRMFLTAKSPLSGIVMWRITGKTK